MRDEKLISAIRQGDETAINYAMDKYSRLLWSIAAAVLENTIGTQDVEECVADVFVYLWQHPEKYDPARGKLKVWLSLLTRSMALDRYRAAARRSTVPLEDTLMAAQPDLADGLAAQQAQEKLSQALTTLDTADRDLLLRRYVQQQKPKEISLALGLPVKQVENRLYRTKLKLRALLQDQ